MQATRVSVSDGTYGLQIIDVVKKKIHPKQLTLTASWWRSIVVRPPVVAGELSLSCARLMAGRVTTFWVKRPLSVNQHGQLSQPSLRGRLNE